MSTASGSASDRPLSAATSSLRRSASLVRLKESAIRALLFSCAAISILTTFGIVSVLFSNAIYDLSPQRVGADGQAKPNEAFFQQVSVTEFVTETRWTPQFSEKHFGILPLICGTLLISGIAALIGLPIGLCSAIYLSEYAAPQTRMFIKPVLEVLAGIPTVVYGYFALVFVTPYVLKPLFHDLLGIDVGVFNAASAGIVVGIMIIPMISSLSEDVLRSVPRSVREAAYALGSTRFDVSTRVVVPAALSGIIASFLLAIARAIGETMAVLMVCGNIVQIPDSFFAPIRTLTANIALEMAYATGAHQSVLFVSGLSLLLIVGACVAAAGRLSKGRIYG